MAEALGDGGSRVALTGHQDHDQAQGEAEGTVEEGQEPGSTIMGGRYEDSNSWWPRGWVGDCHEATSFWSPHSPGRWPVPYAQGLWPPAQTLRNRTSWTEWSRALRRTSQARSRVGRMFSRRLTPLISAQMRRAVAMASAVDGSAYRRK